MSSGPAFLGEIVSTDAPLLRAFGMEFVSGIDGRAELTAIPPAELANSHEVIHGSLVFALADTAAAYALASRGLHPITIGSNLSFTRPALAGVPLRATAEVVTQGRALATVQAEVTADGKIVAHGTFQFALLSDGRTGSPTR